VRSSHRAGAAPEARAGRAEAGNRGRRHFTLTPSAPDAPSNTSTRPTDDQRAEATWFFAFADPMRLRILRALVAGKKTPKELAEACALDTSNISGHAGKLQRAGLIVIMKKTESTGGTRWRLHPRR
jgi:hypothetical protein